MLEAVKSATPAMPVTKKATRKAQVGIAVKMAGSKVWIMYQLTINPHSKVAPMAKL
ncbi:hypothetical protein D3C73_1643580 [compost metagenome]